MPQAKIVKPQPLSGFPEWSPAEKLVEQRFLDIIRQKFERAGFTPIETPAVERKEILAAKGVADKEIYALARLAAGDGEDPSTEMALHYDLTVPTARYVAQHFSDLTFPFRRYQIQKVWRGERPQAFRFREFYQCDIDIIGNGGLSPLADAEVIAVIGTVFEALDIGGFQIRLNNRKLLLGLLAAAGVAEPAQLAALRIIDDLEKTGADRVVARLEGEAGLDRAAAARLVERLAGAAAPADFQGLADNALLEAGIDELETLAAGLRALGMPGDQWRLDAAIARGLDYYTGTVCETQLLDHPEAGSVCSGGRYEDLASTYIKQTLPGVGVSIGLTRLLHKLFDAGVVTPGRATTADILVTVLDRELLTECLEIAAELRAAGLNTEVFTEAKKFPAQLKYADQKGHRLAVILGTDEQAAHQVKVKNLVGQHEQTVARHDLIAHARAVLG